MEHKSIRKWLESLPEPYRGQALRNVVAQHKLHRVTMVTCGTLTHALSSAFSWTGSAEGFEYWNDYHEELKA